MLPEPKRTIPTLPRILRLFLASAALAWIICLGAEFVSTHLLHLSDYRYQRITLRQVDDYADARMFPERLKRLHTPAFFDTLSGSPFLYPAPDAFIYRAMEFGRKPVYKMMLTLAILTVLVALWFYRQLERRGLTRRAAILLAVGSLLTSYPFFFELNRGNIEIFVWLFSAAGIWAFLRERPWLAASLIGSAGACKGYPFIYLGLLFARKQYRQMLWSIAFGFGINYFCLWAITNDFALGRKGVAAGLEEFKRAYVLRLNAPGLDHSFFGFYKRFANPLPPVEQLNHILTGFLIVTALMALAAYVFRVYKMPPINQVVFLAVAAITLPPTSYDYTLMHLYTGFALLVFLVLSHHDRPLPRGVWLAFLCYVVLLTPQNEIILHGERLEGQIKCLALVALAVVALVYPFRGNPAATVFSERALA